MLKQIRRDFILKITASTQFSMSKYMNYTIIRIMLNISLKGIGGGRGLFDFESSNLC